MADQQPIWLTHRPENPNGADLIVLIDLAECDDPSTFAMCCLLFDGHDASAVTAARERWRVYREAGHSLSYWQQGERGGWEKKA